MRYPAIAASILIAAEATTVPCWSQDSSGITDTTFSSPGARSIGLGGAFAAIADDATAAFANPAGLIQILRPEISFELRATASRNSVHSGLDQGVSGLGFFSFVLPSRNWAFALYSHQVASVGFTVTHSDIVAREFEVRSYAAAAAYEISDHLSLGAGLSYFDGNRTQMTSASGFSDSDWGFNAGILWNISRTWNLAGFYRQGPEFEALSGSIPFSFPTEYGVGVAFRPKAGAVTVGFELDRIGSTTDPLQNGHAITDGGAEYHLGVEYAVLKWKPVAAFRAGLWIEADRQHEVFYDLGVVRSSRTEERNHVALGFGLAFKRFQIDAGLDFSDQDLIGSASFVVNF